MEPNAAQPDPAIPVDLLAAGDPRFVAALRAVADAVALARFAAAWHADAQPGARSLLLAYLDEPPNAPGHEGLIKRLFKLAEAAGDDEVMARFLVLGDRLIVRRGEVGHEHRRRTFATVNEARTRQAEWAAEGWHVRELHPRGYRRIRLLAWRPTTAHAKRGTTLPRPDWEGGAALAALAPGEIGGRRWFAVATRRYLQRRAWRYFRALGRSDPARYLAAAVGALGLYRDDEFPDGFALLDHFGLMHLLFGGSPALRLRSTGWDLAPGNSLAELAPSPAFAAAWRDRPDAVLDVLRDAQAPVIARWAVRWVEADRDRFARLAAPALWVGLLDRDDPAVVGLALAMLEALPGERVRGAVTPATWIKAVEQAAPANLGPICDLVGRLVRPDQVPRAGAVRLALSRFEPVARLGWAWIGGQGGVEPATTADRYEACFPADDPQVRVDLEAALQRLFPGGGPAAWDHALARDWILFPLLAAPYAALRPAMLDQIGQAVAGSPLQVDWVWGLLHSPHAEARSRGRAWLEHDRSLRDDPQLWGRMIAAPPPDPTAWRPLLAGTPPVERARLDPVLAALLLQPHGAARAKPAAIRQLGARLLAIPVGADADVAPLLDLLATVARSPRAPERRGALATLVTLAEARPDWQARIEAAVPALQFAGGPAIMPASVGR